MRKSIKGIKRLPAGKVDLSDWELGATEKMEEKFKDAFEVMTRLCEELPESLFAVKKDLVLRAASEVIEIAIAEGPFAFIRFDDERGIGAEVEFPFGELYTGPQFYFPISKEIETIGWDGGGDDGVAAMRKMSAELRRLADTIDQRLIEAKDDK